MSDDAGARRPPGDGVAGLGPTRVGSAVAALASVGLGVVLAARVGPTGSVVAAVGAALAYAASLWLVGRERWRLPAVALAGPLALVAGVGFAVAVGYTSLELLSSLFPVTDLSRVRPLGLRVASTTGAVAGATAAVVGGVAGLGATLRGETVRAHAALTVKTLAVPLSVAALSALTAFLSARDPAGLAALVDLPAALVSVFLAPAPGRTHLLSFAVLLTVAAALCSPAIAALPVAELATGRTRERAATALARGRTWARRVAVAGAALLVVSPVELALGQPALADLLPDALYGVAVALTGSGPLRLALATVLVASAVVLAVVALLRRSVRTGPRDLALAATPFVGGAAVVALVVLQGEPVLALVLSFVADRLPGGFGEAFARQSGVLVEAYGPVTVAMVAAAALVGVTAAVSVALALATVVGSLPARVTGPALAAAGLFGAAAFGAGAGLSPALVLGGVVASLVVWDAGEYAHGLGREVGRAGGDRTPELAHLGGTLVVGLFGAGAALAVVDLALGRPLRAPPTLSFAFGAVLVGLVLLVTALR